MVVPEDKSNRVPEGQILLADEGTIEPCWEAAAARYILAGRIRDTRGEADGRYS